MSASFASCTTGPTGKIVSSKSNVMRSAAWRVVVVVVVVVVVDDDDDDRTVRVGRATIEKACTSTDRGIVDSDSAIMAKD